MKILIAGGGIAGLATGWRLAQAGHHVEIIERGRAGRGASWASAGMLAPGVEIGTEPGPLAQFAHQARRAWPAFAQELETESGIHIGLREDGSIIAAENEPRAQYLQQRAHALGAAGMNAEWLSPSALHAREPLLSPDLRGALFVGGDAQADNRALSEALIAALARRGVTLREICEARSLFVDKDRVQGLVTSDGMIAGDAVILASGAWLNHIGGIAPEVLPQVTPAKGQILALETPAGTALPKALLWSEDVYLVPRRNRLFVGATMEDAGFDTSVTNEARAQLLAAAARLIPAAPSWRVAEIWAGLRPRSQDGAPVLGQTSICGLYVAGGQFRNGILFAPLVAETVARAVMGKPVSPPQPRFDPRRFEKRTA
jgi:glycine oxidase